MLASSPRSDLREYNSGIPATKVSNSVKRPCQDEPVVKFCSIILTLTLCIHVHFKNVREITKVCCLSVKQIAVSFSCVYPVIDYEFRHNIVHVAIDNRYDPWKTNVNLFLTNCQIVRPPSLTRRTNYKYTCVFSFRLLTMKISQWALENFCSYRKIYIWIFPFRPLFPIVFSWLQLYLV